MNEPGTQRRTRRFDLHTHSSCSDGSDEPAELVAKAAAAGLEVVALTDHDTVEGVQAARDAGALRGVEVLAGCEITGLIGRRVVHLLCWGDGLLDPEVAERLGAVRRQRLERNARIGEKLHALTGVGYGEAVEVAGEAALSRAHFAQALIAHGVVSDVAEAFDSYLSNGRPAYMPAPALPISEAVALAHDAGAVIVLAHPGRLAVGEQSSIVAATAGKGVDGIEVWHSQHDADAQRRWAGEAARLGLLATGGSDYHGAHKPGVELGSGLDGNVEVPEAAVLSVRAGYRESPIPARGGAVLQR